MVLDRHKQLTEAVDHFLWFAGFSDADKGEITDAVFHLKNGAVINMGTETFTRLMDALKEYGHSDVYIREGNKTCSQK